jgi:hypothetical protein
MAPSGRYRHAVPNLPASTRGAGVNVDFWDGAVAAFYNQEAV